jgi:SAM-dependent methyltransferase
MLPREAQWLGRRIRSLDPGEVFPMLNIGSSTGRFVTVEQPWIDDNIFRPLREAGHSVVNCDIKAAPGVELVGDLTDPEFLRRLSERRFRSVMCSNLLEHVTNREALCRTLVQLLEPGGLLFVSGPFSYPWHADPIDTLFRPTPAELTALFPGTETVASEVVPCGTHWEYVTRSPRKLLQSGVRLLLPFYQPKSWYTSVLRLGWLFRDFEAVCVVMRKSKAEVVQ